jgi:predicted small integral membrane protein
LAIYAAFSILFVTGAAWLLADRMKDASLLDASETWQTATAYLLMLHGDATMVTLMLLGALVPLHMRRAWRSGRNRITGTVMVSCNVVLITTSFGLYYAGSELLRPWMSNVHIGVGLCLPVLFLVHVFVGRRSP